MVHDTVQDGTTFIYKTIYVFCFTKHKNRILLLLRLYCSHRLTFEKTKGNVILTPLADVFWADFWDVMVHDTVQDGNTLYKA